MKFVKSAYSETDYLNDKIEFCLIGRSNVGKSSIINALANQQIAKVSSYPGRTQLVNYFDANNYYLVDLPGYGYAKLSKQQQQELVYVVENYLFKSKRLSAIFQVVDVNVITQLDVEMSQFFNQLKVAHYIIVNKIDKQLKKYTHQIDSIANKLGVKKKHLIAVSATNKINLNQLKAIFNHLSK